ncbi:MAG: type II toxin-antitoxin system PemK/MazF family toxin [Nitratireductor sp.]
MVGFDKRVPARCEVWLVNLEPVIGSEIAKTRPCVIVSPDEINRNLKTVIIAPLTSATKHYASRVAVKFDGKSGQVALDQIRTISKMRLAKRLGHIDPKTWLKITKILREMFS